MPSLRSSDSGNSTGASGGYSAVRTAEFELSIPSGWRQVDLSADDLGEAMKDLDVSESFERELLRARRSAPSAGVFFVFDPASARASPEHFTTNANIVKIPTAGVTTEMLERAARRAARLLDGRDLVVERRRAEDGQEIVVTSYRATKFEYPLTQRQYYVPGSGAVYVLTLTTDRVKPYRRAFDTIGASFRPR